MMRDAAEVRLEVITEKDFLAQIREAANLLGWAVYHTHDSRRSPEGFPDLVLLKGRRCVIAEVKTHKGKLTPSQREWLARWQQVPGVEVYRWRPQHWEAIVATLKGEAMAK